MDSFLGQIIMFGGNFAIRGWALCDGQLLSVAQNNALFSLLGTTYGGDGRTTFALPDLRGRVPLHQGQGPGMTARSMGQKFGSEDATVSGNEMPSHTHPFNAENLDALNFAPNQALLAVPSQTNLYGAGTPPDTMDSSAIGNSSGGAAHPNVMPFLGVNFMIALTGVYPSRN